MLLDLSLVFLSDCETTSEISIKASKFTTPRALSINKQCIPYICRQLHLSHTFTTTESHGFDVVIVKRKQ